MDEATMQIHIKKGLVHVIRCAVFALAWFLLTWILSFMGGFGVLLYGILSLPFVVGGLVFCWRDIAPGWDKGLMVGALYGIVIIVLMIVFKGLLGFIFGGFLTEFPIISARVGGFDLGAMSNMFDGLGGLGDLGGMVPSWFGIHFGWPGIWPSFFGLVAFGAAFSYIKDFIVGKLKIDSPV